jgi:hypothetical protein
MEITDMSVHEGGCLCGAIRYAAKSQPMRVTICHCRFCQRATGSAYLVEPIFGKSDFTVISGQPKVYRHRSAGSGQMVEVHFCGDCGTKLFLTFERFPGVIGAYGGTFDDPNWFERTAANSRHIFLSAAQRGTVIPAGINCFEEHVTTNDGQPNKPHVFSEHHMIGSDR